MAVNYVNLRTVIDQLENALEESNAIHGCEYEDDGKNNAANRELSSRLLQLSDTLQLASSLVKNEYWNGRQK